MQTITGICASASCPLEESSQSKRTWLVFARLDDRAANVGFDLGRWVLYRRNTGRVLGGRLTSAASVAERTFPDASVDSIMCRNSLNTPLQPTHTHARMNPADRRVKFSAASWPPMKASIRGVFWQACLSEIQQWMSMHHQWASWSFSKRLLISAELICFFPRNKAVITQFITVY